MSAAIDFRDALQAVFGRLEWLPEADGQIHRFHVPGDRSGSRNGWYLLFADGIASGCFGSWRVGDTHTWSSRKPTDPLEAQLIAQRVDLARQKRDAERMQRQQSAADYAARSWSRAPSASRAHAYLMQKRVGPHGLRQQGNRLLVPLYRDGALVNLQRIGSDGDKRFLFGGALKGCYSPIGTITQTLYVCEGWATGATIHEATGLAVACAMNAGNLEHVALVLRAKYPNARLVIAGDDDRQTEGNPGRKAATAAALAVGGEVSFPDWPADAPASLTDFNDLACWSADHD